MINVSLFSPFGVAVAVDGTVYVLDRADHRVWRISPSGEPTPFAGTGVFGDSGDGGPAALAQLWGPAGLAVDSRGNLYIAAGGSHTVRRVDATTGISETVAGSGTRCQTPGPADGCGNDTLARAVDLNTPSALAFSADGDLLIFERQRVRRLDLATERLSTIVGTGENCTFGDSCGSGGLATAAQVAFGESLAVWDDVLYIGESGNSVIRSVDLKQGSSATIERVAGTPGVNCFPDTDPCGDGGAPDAALLRSPSGLAFDDEGALYFASDVNKRIRRIGLGDPSPTVSTVAGTGEACASPTASCGDGMAPSVALFGGQLNSGPAGVRNMAFDSEGT